jgi:hypothetical protein
VEIKNGQSRESGNFWVHKAHDEGNQNKKTQHNMCWTPLCASKHK